MFFFLSVVSKQEFIRTQTVVRRSEAVRYSFSLKVMFPSLVNADISGNEQKQFHNAWAIPSGIFWLLISAQEH